MNLTLVNGFDVENSHKFHRLYIRVVTMRPFPTNFGWLGLDPFLWWNYARKTLLREIWVKSTYVTFEKLFYSCEHHTILWKSLHLKWHKSIQIDSNPSFSENRENSEGNSSKTAPAHPSKNIFIAASNTSFWRKRFDST